MSLIIFNRTLMPRLHILFEAGTPKVELEACKESVVPGWLRQVTAGPPGSCRKGSCICQVAAK